MSTSFSGEELLEIAVQIEKNGQAFYAEAASRVRDQKARDLLTWLSQEEGTHIIRFNNILTNFKPADSDMSPADYEEYSLYLKALADSRVFTTEIKAKEAAASVNSADDAIDMAIGFEKDTLLFLQGIRPLVKGSDRKVVDELQAEEMMHLKKLVGLKK